jgi:hypothetical protein
MGDAVVGSTVVGVAVGSRVMPSQQSRPTPSAVGQQSPVSCSAAQMACAAHDRSAVVVDGPLGGGNDGGGDVGDGTVVGSGVTSLQQSRKVPSTVGQQSPASWRAEQVVCALQAAAISVVGEAGTADGAAAVGDALPMGGMAGGTSGGCDGGCDGVVVVVSGPVVGAAMGSGVMPSQQSRPTPSAVGQQSPVSCSAAQMA